MADGSPAIVPSATVPPHVEAPPAAPKASAPKAVASPAPAAPVVEADPFEELLKSKPISIKNKAGKSVEIKDRKALEHYLNKGFGSHEAHEKANRLEAEVKSRDEVLRKLEAGDDMSVEMLRKALGPKWKQIVQQEALRDFDEEERMKGIPPHIRQKLEEADRLKADRAEQDQRQQWEQSQRAKQQQDQQLTELQQEVARIGIPALQKLGFPSAPPAIVLSRLAGYMSVNLDLAAEKGLPELPVEVLVEELKKDMQGEYKPFLDSYVQAKDFDGAVKWLGEDFVNFIRRGDLARLRGGGAAPAERAPAAPASTKEDPSKFWRY